MAESTGLGEAGPGNELRVTRRCLSEDLDGTSESDARRPIEEIANPVVQKFVAMRSQDPRGLEKVQPLENASDVYSLHAGRWRGATWHDRENDVVWLLGGRLHRSGAAGDAYPYFKQLDADQRLLPEVSDYELLFEDRAGSFVDDVIDVAPRILDRARGETPSEVEAVVGNVPVTVAVVVEEGLEMVYLAVSMSEWADQFDPPANWIAILWAAFFPWVVDPVSEIDLVGDIVGRPAKDSELIYVAMRET